MSKEKQIEEIAKLICNFPQCVNYNIIGECKACECQIADNAEKVYNAGYRKQSEGEWIVKRFNSRREFITCSTCNSVIDCIYQNVDEREFDFCPYCGAKMKGGK